MQADLRTYDRSHLRPAAPSRTLISRLADGVLGPRGCLFTFHRAARPADWADLPNRDFYLDIDFLDRLLTHLIRQGWDIVTIDDAVERARGGSIARKFVNFSVDDCYRDTYELVVPLFRRHAAPVTLFVTTGIPDDTLPLVFAGLEDVLCQRDRVRLEAGGRDLASSKARRELYAELAAAWDGADAPAHYARFCQLNEIDQRAMHVKHAISWQMLEELARDPLVEIGAHTISHARISALSQSAAQTELSGSRQRLQEKLDLPIRHFAFPYGRSGDCGPRDFEIATAAGFVSASTTRKGLVKAGAGIDRLPRITLNGRHQSLALVEAHLSGLSAALARGLGRV